MNQTRNNNTPKKNFISFMKHRYKAFILSGLLVIISLFSMVANGFNFSIDFTGGLLIEVRLPSSPNISEVRKKFVNVGNLGEINLQNFGSQQEILIRTAAETDQERLKKLQIIKDVLQDNYQGVEYRRVDYVGPVVGDEMINASTWAVLVSLVVILFYIWIRFEWQFGLGGVICLIHDAILMMGFFSITNTEFGLPAIAAILTITGYSINDSVVIYDRMRENMRKYRKKTIAEIIDMSCNDNLRRIIFTSLTTALAVVAIAIFGGEIIRALSISLLFGVIIGTYSSIFVAAPMIIYMGYMESRLNRPEESEK